MAAPRTLLLVGCGRMGSALLERWKKSRPADVAHYWVIEPNHPPVKKMESQWVSNLEFLPASVRPHIIVFAVKPQELSSILPAYESRFGTRPLYLSIAAAKTLGFYETYLGTSARIVRAMPNVAALVGKGMTALCARKSLSLVSRTIATELMQSVGEIAWVENDAMMDVTTAISGSGPAYVFLFLDTLIKSAIDAGLPEDIAKTLVYQTVLGSSELAKHSKVGLEELRQQVTSPGGTTEAALYILMRNDAFAGLFSEAIQAAIDRAKLLI